MLPALARGRSGANRSQRQVSASMNRLWQRLPFPLLGIDSDNDSGFINTNLYRYCRQDQITFPSDPD